MDIEELSKSQIVLLTLLVSFVTSIATGIVTVSLMEQAPPALTQTVNRVIERTVEKVVPVAQTAATVAAEKTVVVKESDLIVEAVKAVSVSLVQIHASSSSSFLGLGIVIDESGSVLTDAAMVGDLKNIAVTFSDGTRVPASVLSRDADAGTVVLSPATTTSDGTTLDFTPVALSSEEPALGQAVIVLSGKNIPRVADGLVTALIPRDEDKSSIIDTSVSPDFITGGSPLVTIDGVLLGVSTSISRSSSQGGFMPIPVLAGDDSGKGDTEKATQ